MLDTTDPNYMKEALSWEAERVLSARRSERRAWMVALVACAVALAAVIAVAGLTPLKQTSLRLIRVDKNTGYTDTISEVNGDPLSYDDVKDEFWVSQYVEARERYGEDLAYMDYQKVNLLSDASVSNDYSHFMDPDNKQSPLNVYGKSGKVRVHINSVQLLGNGVASVRYTRTETIASVDRAPTHWIATVAYKYEPMKLTEEERRINPAQFQVTDYRKSTESIARSN